MQDSRWNCLVNDISVGKGGYFSKNYTAVEKYERTDQSAVMENIPRNTRNYDLYRKPSLYP